MLFEDTGVFTQARVQNQVSSCLVQRQHDLLGKSSTYQANMLHLTANAYARFVVKSAITSLDGRSLVYMCSSKPRIVKAFVVEDINVLLDADWCIACRLNSCL